MYTGISIFTSKAALSQSQGCAATFSVFAILCQQKAIIRALGFMRSAHKNHIPATEVTPVGTFINGAHCAFLLVVHSIILFATLGTVARFFSAVDTQSKARENIDCANFGPRHPYEHWRRETPFLLVISSTLLSPTVDELLSLCREG